MTPLRRVKKVVSSVPTLEGAGVRLKRAFGFQRVPELDPFLLLDEFHSDQPGDYLKGFPWHPHRGIETITYMLHGEVEHADSMGNQGTIGPGDVQWMTAGSGIIHQEMPKSIEGGLLWGFQLWANLPAANKMMDPRYRDVKRDQIPALRLENGVTVRIICGEVHGVKGPVLGIVTDPQYLDVTVPAGETFTHSIPPGYTAFAYVVAGTGSFDPDHTAGVESLVVFSDGEGLAVAAKESGVRFLLVSGKPIREPVAWYGPIVMNTQAELETAFEEYQNGTFLKHKR